MSDEIGPNMRKLIAQYIGREAIPPKGGLEEAFNFFQNDEHRRQVVASAMSKVEELMKSVKPHFPTKTDEEIAEILVGKIEEKKRSGPGYRKNV